MKEYRTDSIQADGKTIVTESLQKIIDKAHDDNANLVITKGKYLTASIFIRSNMNVIFEDGAELIGTTDEKEYPIIDTRIAGIEMKAYPGILNVNDAENVVISGRGMISGQGRYWWDKYWGEDEKSGYRGEYDAKGLRWAADYDCRRLRNIVVMNSRNITIKDLISSEPGFWNLHVLYSEHVVIDNVFINAGDPHGPSTDGIDIDSSSDVIVRNCTTNTNDDSICIKSGRDADGYRIGRPCHHVTVENCHILSGFGVTIGSEISGGIHDIVLRGLTFENTDCGFRIKSSHPRRGYIRNVIATDLKMINVRYPVHICLDWNRGYSICTLPEEYRLKEIPDHWKKLLEQIPEDVPDTLVENVLLKNITASLTPDYSGRSRAFNIEGYDDQPIQNLIMENVSITADEFGIIKAVKNQEMKNVKLTIKGSNDKSNDDYDNR